MTADRIQSGERDRILFFAKDGSGAGLTGATIAVAIKKDIDNVWWNGTGFQSSYTTVNATEADSTNLPGIYYLDIQPASTVDGGLIIYATSSSAGVANSPWVGQIKVGGFTNYITADISSIGEGVDLLSPTSQLLSIIRASVLNQEDRIAKIALDVSRLVKAQFGGN